MWERLSHEWIQWFPGCLALFDVRLIVKYPVEAHHLPAVRPDDDVFDSPDDLINHGHGPSAGAGLWIPGGVIPDAIANEGFVGAEQADSHDFAGFNGLAEITIGAQNLDDAGIWADMETPVLPVVGKEHVIHVVIFLKNLAAVGLLHNLLHVGDHLLARCDDRTQWRWLEALLQDKLSQQVIRHRIASDPVAACAILPGKSTFHADDAELHSCDTRTKASPLPVKAVGTDGGVLAPDWEVVAE